MSALRPRTSFGAYEILSPLGAGGMGEVYRARDSRLGREVALKILPPAVSQDPDRVARFAREAQVLAALNHPNIAAIYGLEEAAADDGTTARALILELVEGETLAERIARGPLLVGDALRVAGQLGDALDAAHKRGVVHRDLKPANIKVTPEDVVKVLDFGLAKTFDSQSRLIDSPTMMTLGTHAGVVMGTPGYMSPEQARGHPVDRRTDIWAFGCVLFEMLTGRRAFDGQTMSDAIARILEREPDWAALPRGTPPPVRELLKRCLDKDPAGRPADLAAVRAILDQARAPRARSARSRAMAALAGALTLAALWWLRSDRLTPTGSSSWEQITSFPDSVTQPALSPDGRMLAFIRGESTFAAAGEVYLKRLPHGDPTPLTSDGLFKMDPVFSPDGNRLAYTAVGNRSLRTAWDTWVIPEVRGNARSWLKNASGLTWVGPSQVLFSEIKDRQHMGIVTASDSRADPRELYFPVHRDAMAHRSSRSPDGQWVLVVEMDEGGVFTPCRLIPWQGGSGRLVGPTPGRCTSAAWAPDGRWMYFAADTGRGFHVWRQRFPGGEPEQVTAGGTTEEEGLAIAGDGRSLITSVGQQKRGVWIHDASGERQISLEGYAYWPLFSANGRTLCFRVTRSVATGQTPSELWMSDLESGRIERLLPTQLITQYDLSQDDRLVASVREPDGKSRLWLASLDGREPPRRLGTLEGSSPRFGAGGTIYFLATDRGSLALFRTDDTGRTRERVSSDDLGLVLGLVSPDGAWLTVARGLRDVVALPTGGGAAVPVLQRSVARLRWSPDGMRVLLQVQAGSASAFGFGRTYVLPPGAGSMLPRLPPGGFKTETEIALVPGVEILPYSDLAFSPTPGVYAFSKIVTTRNLYRVPLR